MIEEENYTRRVIKGARTSYLRKELRKNGEPDLN